MLLGVPIVLIVFGSLSSWGLTSGAWAATAAWLGLVVLALTASFHAHADNRGT